MACYKSINIYNKKKMKKKLTHNMKNVLKGFTKVALMMGLFSILMSTLIKFHFLPYFLAYFNLEIADIWQYIISGSLVLVLRLGFWGIIEPLFQEYLPQGMPMNTGGSYTSLPSKTDSSTILKMDGKGESSKTTTTNTTTTNTTTSSVSNLDSKDSKDSFKRISIKDIITENTSPSTEYQK